MLRIPLNGGRFRRFAALAFAGVTLVAAPARAKAQELRYTRPVDVSEPGWVRVPLPAEVLRHAGAGGGIRLFGPEGDEVSVARRAVGVRPRRRRVEVLPAEPAGNRWRIPLEVSPGARLHELLVLAVGAVGAESPPAVELEGSADGRSWRPLAAGALTRVRGRLVLPYPATDRRHLRLSWPRPAGDDRPPQIAAAAVEAVPPGAFRLSVARPDCRPGSFLGSSRTVCRLPIGDAGRYLRRLCFAVQPGSLAAYRLFTADAGRWEPVAEEAATGSGSAASRCVLLDLELAGELEPLRLELYGGGGDDPPVVAEVAAGFAPELLLFQAARAGTHTLAYGPAVFPSGRERAGAPPAGEVPAVVVPGPEEASEVPASALAFPGAAGPAPAVRFERRWDLTAEAPIPGQLHRLSLPAEVYAVAAPDLADLRLLVAGAGSSLQVPFVRWRPDEPALASVRLAVEPEPASPGAGSSRVRTEPVAPGLPLSALVLSAAPAAGAAGWTRAVRVWEAAASDADGEAPPAGPWVEWRCPARPPLPCRVALPLEAPAGGSLEVEIDDRGAPPLPGVELELWGPRDVLLFPWPDEGVTPVLAAGAAGLPAPEFDLSARAAELVARPWREAGLALDGARGGRLGSVAITLALLLAAGTLVGLLHRILADQAPGRR